MFNVLKDLIVLNIFVVSLITLYRTTDHLLALICVLTIVTIFTIKHIKLNLFVKKELKAHREVFETLFNSSSDEIMYIDTNFKIIACNDMLCKRFGFSKNELIGREVNYLFKNFKEKDRLKHQKSLRKKVANVLATNKPIQYFQEFNDYNSSYFNILVSPAYSSNDTIMGVLLVSRNITAEHKSARVASEKSTQLNSILENMPICAFMKDKNGRFIIGSSSFEKTINLAEESMQQLRLSDVFEEEYLKFIKEEEAEIYKNKQPIVRERQVVLPNQSFWGRIRKAPVFDKNGDVKAIVVMYENIESEKEIERQKEYFIETLIHDLKVPTLAQLRGLELLHKGAFGNLTNEQGELIGQIEDSCKYILEMISMVLNTYKFENGQNPLYYEKFNISELLLECFDKTDSLAQEKNLRLIYQANTQNTEIEADKNELRKVMINLISNAVLYSDKNEQILVTISSVEDSLKFSIVSRGITLSQRECSTLFERTTNETPKYTTVGHGIGLYLCKKIIDIHGGKIFASTDGIKENTITFLIPKEKYCPSSQMSSPMYI